MRDRRPNRFARARSHRHLRRMPLRDHRAHGVAPDLVEDVLGDLGWRRIDRLTQGLRRGLRSAFLIAAVVVAGSIALEAADRGVSSGDAGSLDDAMRRFGEMPPAWRDAGWSGWVGGTDAEPTPTPAPDRLESLVAAAPWSPV